ncbi:MAG: undecaprenyl-diphosphate phosphatase [Deltaproteobacteria bacterium]|nr:undecaprenyl-diphosphate phosphatase [Deltaproteobacteria bacterium]
MSYFQAIILGAVQGLTEFLPVSSSGHLVLTQHLMGLNNAEELLLFDVALHWGTLLSVLVYYYADLFWMAKDSFLWVVRRKGDRHEGARILLSVGIATAPATVVGFLFKDTIESLFVSPDVTGWGLLITGTLLWVTQRMKTKQEEGDSTPGLMDAVVIGVAQAVAMIPGISRSGSTMVAGLFRGLSRGMAARFSFLMSIPVIFGAGLLESFNIPSLDLISKGPLLVGSLVSAVTGFLAIRWLLKIIQTARFHWFAYYCWGVGVVTLILL